MNTQKVLEYFYQISQIPRCSGNEAWIRQYLISFAESKKLDYKVDDCWNLVIYVPSTFSKMESSTIVLQSHMDMVCVKDPDYEIDFSKDWLILYEENWYLKAKWTTLWADNWVWMAMMLASVDLANHPKMELLFTVDEERGLAWAFNLDSNMLSWKKVINLDSEDEWDVCISSAWWCRIDLSKKFELKKWEFSQYSLELWWMKWWHSWMEIDKNRWNAIYLLIDFLSEIKDDIEISFINWWTADNVIPSDCKAILGIRDKDFFVEKFDKYLEQYKKENDCPEIFYSIDSLEEKFDVMADLSCFLDVLKSIKIWVYSISEKIPGLVNSSMNLWVIKYLDWELSVCYMARSSIMPELDQIIDNVINIAKPFEYSIIMWTKYPWWQQDPESELVQMVLEHSRAIFKESAKLVAYHAWLECGLIAEKIWSKAQLVSIGPNISGAHSINESLDLLSLARVWNLLENILDN